MPTPQPGIFAQGTRSHRHLELTLRPDVTPARALDALRPLRQPSVTAGGANIVVGFAPSLWRSLSPTAPDASAAFPGVPGVPTTQRDVWVWCHGTGDDALLDVTLGVARLLDPVAVVTEEVAGFVYHDGRDLTGFVDGTENPSVEEAHDVALTPSGGSYAITQRWVHDLTAFHALPVAEQEAVIGRTKADDVELDDDVRPPTAHISRVVVDDADGHEMEIYRRSVPYGTVAEHGLQFVAFSADPARFDAMLRRMYGTDDGVHDRLTEFSRPVTGSAWWVPSLEALGDVLG